MTRQLTRLEYEMAKWQEVHRLAKANWKQGSREHNRHLQSVGMSGMNTARAEVKRFYRAIKAGLDWPAPHVEHLGEGTPATVQGIPCGVVVTEYDPGRHNNWGHPDNRLPDDPEEIEWVLVDRKGYRAEWLEAKMSREDAREVESVALDAIEQARYEV